MIYDKKFTFSEFILNYNEVVGELLSNNNTLFQNYYQEYNIFRGLTKKDWLIQPSFQTIWTFSDSYY